MPYLFQPARIVFGVGLLFFGVEYLAHGHFLPGLPPAPAWLPGAPVLAYLLGATLALTGAAVAFRYRAGNAARTLACACLVCALAHFLHLQAILQNGSVRTGAFEALSIAGAALVLTHRLRHFAPEPTSPVDRAGLLGRLLYAVSMLVFGQQHFQYAAFVAPLIPGWIPWHTFFTYFTGLCFIAAGLAIAFNLLRSLASLLLGAMFLSWYVLVHLPRVFGNPHNNDEWVSATVALTLAAGSFLLASQPEASNLGR